MFSPRCIRLLSLFAIAGAMALAPSLVEGQSGIGLGFCPPPFPPKCVTNSATYAVQAGMDACQEEVNRYVNSVGNYRLCLTRETERAVRETNGTLQFWKCSLANKALCQ